MNAELRRTFSVDRVRDDFPILRQEVHGRPLVYLDNAATTQKPRQVLDAIQRYYTAECANVHRGVHLLSVRATHDYEEARGKVQHFLNAAEVREIVFVRGATEGINLVAASFGRNDLRPGDEVLITAMEHHSNIVPWQLLCQERGAHLRVAPIDDNGDLLLEEYEKLLGPRTRLAAVAHVSNALGTVNPVRSMIEMAHRQGVPVLVDGAQAVAHRPVDVAALDCDFYVFSGHKLFGPTGIGVVYGKARLLDQMPPYQGGGDMIRSVTFAKTTFNDLPYKFEAGTPHVEGAIGLGAAIDYLNAVGVEDAAAHEQEVLDDATAKLKEIPGLRLIGTAREKAGVLSFVLAGIHPHDIGTVLDREGIAIRAGHHCAMPVMERFGVPATARASLAFYNTRAEVDALVRGLQKMREVFA
jgi:cysteine desulfurase/selenocysteine lyase